MPVFLKKTILINKGNTLLIILYFASLRILRKFAFHITIILKIRIIATMKITTLILFLFTVCAHLDAQSYRISGSVVDKILQKEMEAATVQLLKTDTTLISTTITNKNGIFSIHPKQSGHYLLKISFIGYKSYIQKIYITKKVPEQELGKIILEEDAIMLEGAIVKGRGYELSTKKDTFIYNASAFRMPPGATLEELVKKLPGLTIEKDGTIKWNGKTISAIMVNGKNFFANNPKIALENLPTLIIENIKAYEKQSDFTAQTGIEDGEKMPVLDITLKKKYKSNWLGNMTGGLGSEDIFNSRFFLNSFTDRYRISAFGLANNIGENLKPNNNGEWEDEYGRRGLNIFRKAGIDFAWDNGKKEREKGKLEITASVNALHNNYSYNDMSINETFLPGQENSFSYQRTASLSKETEIALNAELKWTIDTLTYLTFSQNFNHRNDDSRDNQRSATFNNDPTKRGYSDPLDMIFESHIPDSLREIAVNRNDNQYLSYGHSNNMSLNTMLVRRLNPKGRTLTVGGLFFTQKYIDSSFDLSDIRYYQQGVKNPQHINNQYTPYTETQYRYTGTIKYSEPLAKGITLSLGYKFEKIYNNSNRPLYQLDSLENWRNMNHPIGSYPSTADSLEMALNRNNSTYATYNTYNHTATLDLSLVKKRIRINTGLYLNPQKSYMDYLRGTLDTTITRNISYLSPYANIRFSPNEKANFTLYYNGRKELPKMTDLLDITDDSNPLYIKKGNPGLKSSWSDNIGLYGNMSYRKHSNMWGSLYYYRSTNTISRTLHYDPTTGVNTTRPENINGNWQISHYGGANIGLDTTQTVRITGYYYIRHSNRVGFISMNNIENVKNTCRAWNMDFNLGFYYTKGWTEASLSGSFEYYNARNNQQVTNNESHYDFSYKASIQLNFPWNMAIVTDFGIFSRRKYNEPSMNKDQVLWNANISQNLLKDKSLTIQLIAKDILGQRTYNYSYMSNNGRYTVEQNGLLSYALLNISYRFNINPSKNKAN